MSYSQGFSPRNGDRVSFEDHYTRKGRVVGYSDTEVVIKKGNNLYRKDISSVIFLSTCPWWLFWQKWR